MKHEDLFDMPGIVACGQIEAFGSWCLGVFGELLIEGEGDMPDWGLSGAPWYEERENIFVVCMSEQITSIGAGAFSGCTNLVSVALPNVSRIGAGAFWGCRQLTKVVIPDGVTKIGDYAFHLCTDLAKICIPEGVTSIGTSAFSQCRSLKELTLPSTLTEIGEVAFHGCTGLSELSVPDSVEKIALHAFLDVKHITYHGQAQWGTWYIQGLEERGSMEEDTYWGALRMN